MTQGIQRQFPGAEWYIFDIVLLKRNTSGTFCLCAQGLLTTSCHDTVICSWIWMSKSRFNSIYLQCCRCCTMDCVQCVSQRYGSFGFCRERSPGGWILLISLCQAMMRPNTATSAMTWPWRWCTWSTRRTRWDYNLPFWGSESNLLFTTDPPWGPCLRSDVRRSGARLARPFHDVGPREAADGQGLRHFCEESPEVDGTWRGVQQRTLWKGNTQIIDYDYWKPYHLRWMLWTWLIRAYKNTHAHIITNQSQKHCKVASL